MLTAQYADLVVWFHPVGNTPAVSLTRGQPPAGDAKTDILLLGCGDARHILFTCNADARPMDITCCDRENAILARNILLLSLLIDDDKGGRSTRHWKLYYHLYISESDLALLQSHARKLCGLSNSLEDWNQGPYGKIFRFADRRSLAHVREMWQLYALKRSSASLRSFESQYHYWLQKSIGIRSQRIDSTGSLRSLCPARIEHADDVNALKNEFWEDLPKRHRAYRQTGVDVRFNPMFAVAGSTSLLHFRTDPLDGYHIALAYIDTSGPVPLRKPKSHQALEIAKAEFCSWSFSFRKSVKNGLTLRFFSGDALAFCQTLQHVRQHPDERTAHLYRDRYTFEPLVLDGDDWGPGSLAPLTFTVIDTSNLLDHLDGPNLLPAVSPLLTCEPFACLYMELLSGRDQEPEKLARSLLCGDLTTIGLLAGLVACDFCMNTSTVSAGHEALVDYFKKVGGSSGFVGHRLVSITWKRALSHGSTHAALLEPLQLHEESLVRILLSMNREIFKRERSAAVLQKMSLAEIATEAGPTSLCHRGGIASFINLIKPRVTTDIEKAVKWLLFELKHDAFLGLSNLYMEEFILHLHLQGVFTAQKLESSPQLQAMMPPPANSILAWANLPPVVSVTLVIPRSSLNLFMQGDGTNSTFGTPFLECFVKSGAVVNAFAALQIGFGALSTSGTRWTEGFQVKVTDNKSNWVGSSTLIVSFMVPSWILLDKPESTEIALCIKSAPDTMHFVAQLGPELTLFSSLLGNDDHVFISENLPNQDSPMKIGGFAACDVGTSQPTDEIREQSLEARLCSSTGHPNDIIGLTRRLRLKSPEIMSKLLAGAEVNTTFISPWAFLINIGDCPPLVASFPVPVNRFAFATRIGRKGDYIELVDDLATGPAWVTSGGSPYPIMWEDNSGHTLWNLSYVPINSLPEVHLTRDRDLRWLQPHLSTLFTSTERRIGLVAQQLGDHTEGCYPAQMARLRLKDSIYRIFLQSAGLDGWKPDAFAIGVQDEGDVQILIFPAKLRLDLSGRTVVLDAMVLPITESLSKKHDNFLKLLLDYGATKLNVGEAELALWKETLPAWVERCRTWEHKKDCEYLSKKSIPLSMEKSKQLLCGCGNGVDLPEMVAPALPDWEEVSEHCVRAAISPVFPCPLVDYVFGPEVVGDRPWYASGH